MRASPTLDSFFGLPERGRFATEPVRRSFLIKREMTERLTSTLKFQGFKYSSWMEALVIQELNPGPIIASYFWHNNYQSATRLMNE